MGRHIDVNFRSDSKEITLPYSHSTNVDIYMEPQSEEFTVGVQDFPSFIKAALRANVLLIQASIRLNMLSQRLIVNTDPLLISNMDNMTISALDIDQDITYNSIS